MSDSEVGEEQTLGINEMQDGQQTGTAQTDTEAKKKALFNKLREKMQLPEVKSTSNEIVTRSKVKKKLIGNTNALKPTRKVEFGWKHCGKTVWNRYGGGTRTVEIGKEETKEEIKQRLLKMYFPGGKCKFGRARDFDAHVEFCAGDFADDVTVLEMYEKSGLNVLRFNLVTAAKQDVFDSVSSDEENFGIDMDEIPAPKQRRLSSSAPSAASTFTSTESQVATIPAPKQRQLSSSAPSAAAATDSNVTIFYLSYVETQALHTDETADETAVVQPTIAMENFTMFLEQTTGSLLHASNNTPTILRIHRVNILAEMVEMFKSVELFSSQLKFELIDETGADNTGISREVYTEFWTSFLSSLADGEEARVPALCPEYGMEEWKAVGRVLVKGYKDCNVFPLQLAEAFIIAVLFGEDAVSTEELMESYSLFLCEIEREALRKALEGTASDDDREILIDILDREGSHSLPNSSEEMKALLFQTAHKAIIQNPAYALEAFRFVTFELFDEFKSKDGVHQLYEKLRPSASKILQLLNVPDEELNKQNQCVMNYFKQYVRSQDMCGLRRLLQFITGSPIVSVPKISLGFTHLSGTSRRPVAHTCGPLLELPVTYANYRDFRNEFDSVLSSGYLLMDIK